MEQLTALLVATAGACLFAILTLFLWREYRIEKFRQQIFQLRDELFDFAAEGHLSFDDPAYGALRGSMNSLIRFAHKMSLSYAGAITLARYFCPNPALDRFSKERMRPLMELPDGEVKKKVMEFHGQMHFEVFRFVAVSPLLVVIVPLAILALAAGSASSLYKRITTQRDEIAVTIEAQALECDHANNESTGILQPV